MRKKSLLARIIFNLLVKGVNGANLYDSKVQQEIKSLPENFVVSLGVFPVGEYITFEINKDIVKKVQNKKADISILFKNSKIANKVLLGRISIAQAFANHALLLKGDIYKSMSLVRIINIVENYLFPKWYTKAIPYSEKEVSSLKMYLYVLFGSKNKKLKGEKNEK